ncbi:hypothetical protein EVAR_25142_1 [Eumeta japonica]|uniref:Uncharacterized protein n=1 Tax=Eumeta variegata TaxID=151549 RepID=A0A4C1XJP1_EUMVA|nr:hypothetical protein EVAR_25142_1 [Eumeta japonica]
MTLAGKDKDKQRAMKKKRAKQTNKQLKGHCYSTIYNVKLGGKMEVSRRLVKRAAPTAGVIDRINYHFLSSAQLSDRSALLIENLYGALAAA